MAETTDSYTIQPSTRSVFSVSPEDKEKPKTQNLKNPQILEIKPIQERSKKTSIK